MRSPASTFDLRTALSNEIEAAIEALSQGDSGRKAIHACRVRLKRARALARVGHIGAPGLSAVFDDSARSIMQSLAGARDLSALAQTARTLAKQSRKKTARAELKAIAEDLEAARENLPQVDLAAINAGLRDLHSLAQVWPEASERQIRRGARRIVRRARRAWRKARNPTASAERRHDLRQREKDRLYAATLLGDAWPVKRRLTRNRTLTELLGQEHDIRLLITRLTAPSTASGGPHDGEAALRVLRRRQAKLMRRSRRVSAQLHRKRA